MKNVIGVKALEEKPPEGGGKEINSIFVSQA